MIRLITATTINGGYLNFMGNEFGHPEWIDFPREGNGWSHKYARRQWSLVDNSNFLYHALGKFDQDMLAIINRISSFNKLPLHQLWDNEGDQVLAYERDKYLFVFNFNGTKSFEDYGILSEPGTYKVVLNTDNEQYGGYGFVDESIQHDTLSEPKHESGKHWLKLYLPARSAQILEKL